jgi:hypothetical protein
MPYEERNAYLSRIFAGLPGRSAQLSFAADLIRDCNFEWHWGSVSASITQAIEGAGLSGAIASSLVMPMIKNPPDVTKVKEPQIEWDEVFKGPINSVDDFLVSFGRLHEARALDGRDQFFIEAIRRVQPDKRRIFLEGLSSASAVRTYELVDLIIEARKQWQFSPALLSLVPKIIKSYADRHAAKILFDNQRYSVAYDVGRIMNIDRDAASDVFSTFIGSASDSLDGIEADTAFALVNLACRLINGEAARSVFEFALERFERILKPDDGDGTWGNHLAPPPKLPDALAGLIVSALASPETETRWRAAHAVVRLLRYRLGAAYGARVFRWAEEAPGHHGGNCRANPPSWPEQAGRQGVLHRLPRRGMKLHSHSLDCQRISQGSSRSLALYRLGSHETQREASVSQDGV